jgi:hypothetical protein
MWGKGFMIGLEFEEPVEKGSFSISSQASICGH